MPNGKPYVRARWLTDEELAAMEGFDFGSIARAVGPAVSTALPGVIQGASTGAAAGPWGALVGGLAGGALSLATQPQPGARPAAAPPTPATPPAPAPAPVPPIAPAAGAPTLAPSATPAAAPLVTSPGAAPTASGQLVQLLLNPAFQQAVSALAAGQGRSAAGLAAGPVLNLLGSLANNAAYEAEAVQPGVDDSYLRGPDGRFLRDPSAPGERAAIVWDRLFATRPLSGESASEADDPAEWLVEAGMAEPVD